MDPKERLNHLFGLLFKAHPWHGVPPFAEPGLVNVYIELVPTDTVKYELDKSTGHLRLERPQRFSSLCPMLYGFIPQTYCGKAVAERCAERTGHKGIEGDGDPMDICLLSEKATAHGDFLARARPIGGLRMIDGSQADDKVIAVLESDVSYGHFREVADCPPGVIERLQHYFLSYKQRPNDPAHRVDIAEVYDRSEASEMIRRSLADYRERFGAAEERLMELRRLLAGG
jgi:inorganic pyrophosphatase